MKSSNRKTHSDKFPLGSLNVKMLELSSENYIHNFRSDKILFAKDIRFSSWRQEFDSS